MKKPDLKAIELGSIIKSHRTEQKISQKQLSVMIFGNENHNASISRIESGKLKEVQFFTIYNILKALDIDIFTLIQNS